MSPTSIVALFYFSSTLMTIFLLCVIITTKEDFIMDYKKCFEIFMEMKKVLITEFLYRCKRISEAHL